MIRSRLHQLTIVFVLAVMCLASVGSEPNDVKMKLKFEVDEAQSKPWIRSRGTVNPLGRGPIEPSHVAVFHIRRPSAKMPSGPEGILQILQTSAAKSLSEQQRKFVSGSDALVWWGIDEVQNHDTVLIYAVSEEDARKTVEAYFEIAVNKADDERKKFEGHIREAKAKLDEIEEALPKKQQQAEKAREQYNRVKADFHPSLSDDEAYGKAKETMLQVDKMLDVIEIELAGIREKLTVINEYRKTPQSMEDHMRLRQLPEGMLVKLEQMYVEQTIELKSAEARKQAALKIRGRDTGFLGLFNRCRSLEIAVKTLVRDREGYSSAQQRLQEGLEDPERLPPVVYQDKVTIYPVKSR